MSGETVQFATLRFGEISVAPELVVAFPKGILGFENGRRFVIIETPETEPFSWMQSLDDPALAFVIVNPMLFFADYKIDVDRRELDELEIKDQSTVATYAIVSVPDGELTKMSANLQGPILINTQNNLAKQLVLSNGPYTTRHYLLDPLPAADGPGNRK